jgi:DNA primase
MSATVGTEAIKAAAELPRIVGETLKLQKEGDHHVGLCPFHNERTGSFKVYADHYHCFGCNQHGDVYDWLVKARNMSFHEAVDYLVGGKFGPAMQGDRSRRRERRDRLRVSNPASARRIWSEASPPTGSPAEAYLRSRGLALPDEPVIRFHPACPHGRSERLPAMVALMVDAVTGEPTGIHRTFLRQDGSGKADVPQPKMMLGPAGVVRLCEPVTAGLGLSEGIETALAVAQRIGWGPVWAAGGTTGIRNFPPLIERTLNLFIDHDQAGITAAEQCAGQWAAAGLETFIHTPPPGTDWADAAGRLA